MTARSTRGVLLAAAALAASLVHAAGAQAAVKPVLTVDPGSAQCRDSRPVTSVSAVAPWCSLQHALDAAPGGSVVSLRAGTYPPAQIEGRRLTRRLTFKPFAREAVTIGGISIDDASNLGFQGFRITGRTNVRSSSRIRLVGNDISPQGITVRPSDKLLIARNRIHDITYDGARVGAGYGVELLGVSSRVPGQAVASQHVTIRGNHFTRIPADGIQAGTIEDLQIEDNEFQYVTPFLDPTEHSDAIQLLATSRGVTIRRNFFHDEPRALIAKGAATEGLVIENNVMVRLSNLAMNIYDAPNARIVNNTVWDTGGALRLLDLPEVPAEMKNAVVANNILDSLWAGPEQMRVEAYNVIGKRDPARRYGPDDIFGSPGFVSPRRLDYRLRRTSPAIDSAWSLYAPARDRNGARRVDIRGAPNRGAGATRYADRGALEYGPAR